MQILDLPDDQQITENGFYRISMDRHHNQPCDGVSVTSSVLRTIENKTPADVWAFHKLNPDRFVEEDRTALRLGRLMASYIEGGIEEVQKTFAILPATVPKRPTAAQKKAVTKGTASPDSVKACAFWARVEDDPRDVITAAQWKMVREMGAALSNDPAAVAALGGEAEITMAVRDLETDLWMLARPDQVSFDGLLSDYKKVSSQGRAFSHRLCDARITEHGYDMQMAFACECFEALTGGWPEAVGLLFQWDQPPYHSILRPIEEADLRIAQWRNRKALRTFKTCLSSGHWPGPGEDIGAYQRPDWQAAKIERQMEEYTA